MNIKDIIRDLIEKIPGCSQNSLAERVGLSSQAMSNRMRAGDMKVGFAAKLVNELGYRLVVVPDGKKLPAGSIEVTWDPREGE